MRYPIQKLEVGQILDQSINVVKENFKLLFSIYAVTVLPFNVVLGFLQLRLKPGPNGAPEVDMTYLIGLMVVLPFLLLGYALCNAAMIHGVASLYISRSTDLADCLKSGVKRLLPLVWTGILTFLAVGFGLLLLIVPGIIFGFWFYFSQQVCVIENTSGPDAMKRSKKLMANNYLKAFILGLVVGVINFGIGAVSGVVPVPWISVILQSIAGGVTAIFASASVVILYFSARCEHENFDLQMLSSSVAEEYEAPR